MDEQDDFDGFSDSVGITTITQEELDEIRRSVYRDCPVGRFSAILRLAFMGIAKNRLKELKEQTPGFQLTSVRIDTTTKKVIVE